MNKTKIAGYSSWTGMKTRCYDPKYGDYYRYGGRGIKVCDRWLHSFDNFYEDMGVRPEGLSLDRINNDGDYEPSNCRWADNNLQKINTGKTSRNTSGYRGVHWFKNRWQVKLYLKGKSYYGGRFASLEDAARAYNELSRKHHGVEAYQNQIP